MPPIVLIAGVVVLAGLAIGVLIWALGSSGDRRRQRLEGVGGARTTVTEGRGGIPGVRADAVPVLTQFLEGTKFWQDLQVELIRAGWMLRPSEFVAMCVGAGVGGLAAGTLLMGGMIAGVVMGLLATAIPYMALKSRQQKRLRDLSSQLPDALDMLASSLRSGFALLRAMQVVRSQMHRPIAEEFGRVVDEVQYGITIEQAMDNLVLRTGSYDLELIVAAIQTQLSVGGNLAEIFDSIGDMIRERVRLMGELATATAEGRMSAGILIGMPFFMAFMVNLVSPGYLLPLFQSTLGLLMVGAALVLMALGAFLIRKIIDIDV